ncbi:MAG TPA: extracellular solute-binding protein [Xanthobacteraceae bacterium]|nr:extracellular solute-binding protein [Xanthobacteraceae bacterium]
MRKPNRRTVIKGSIGLAVAATVARPYVANAAAKTATAWWNQGFVPEEDASFKAMVAEYEKQSGNKIDYSLIPTGPLMQKMVSSLTSGDVPDIMSHDTQDATVVPQNAWKDKLVDLSDIVEPLKSQLHPTAYLASSFYNSVTKQRGMYQAPYKASVLPFHVWNSLVEKAGLKVAAAPKTWDAFWDYFKPVQTALRKSMRGVYSLGLQATTNGPADGNNLFAYFLAAYGGYGIVTPDGQAHLDDPAVKQAVVKTITYITTAFKQGYVPPGALDWGDADDNNAFHARQIVIDLDGTISTELAMIHDPDKYNDAVTLALPNDNAGKPIASPITVSGAFIPKGAKNVAVAKEFLKYVIQPQVAGAYLKAGLGRWLPAIPSIVKNDPWWTDPKDPHRLAYVTQGILKETVPHFYAYNPGISEVNAAQIWGTAHASVIHDGATPEAAADTALKHIAKILAKYPIGQA